ncbi:MAG: rod-binding protein [Candidatus Sericytochromatia bacterium]|nr:rod-binding protein [Candidatus Sericytochromatia bacterium]
MSASIGPGFPRTAPAPALGPGVGLGAVRGRAGGRDDRARLAEAAREFESIMVQHLLETMRKAKLAEDPLDSGNSADIIHSLQDEAMARSISHGKGLGLAEAIVRDLDLRLAKGGH